MPKLTAPGKYLFRECKNITKGERSGIGEHVLIYVRRMYRLADIDMPVLKKVENSSFNKCEGLTKVDMPTVETVVARSVQQLCKYRDGQSPQREKHRWNRLQQLLAHHLHFSSGASDLHRRSIQRNDRPDEL